VEIATLFEEASHVYQKNPTALQLRAMNILFEGIKQKGALMIVPSSAVQEMGLGGMLGMAAMQQQAAERGPASGTTAQPPHDTVATEA
jgi:hypothetical protein